MRSSSPECVIDEYIGLVRPSSSVAKFTSLAKGISVLGSNFFADKKISMRANKPKKTKVSLR
jgi:hypothetical protein